jgi:hypothetical protein
LVVNNRGLNSIMSFVASLIIILLMGLFVQILEIGVTPEWYYAMSSAESSRECDVTLMNLMKTEAQGQNYNYAQAIVWDRPTATIEIDAYISTFFDNVEFKDGVCIGEENIDPNLLCCSHSIPDFYGRLIPVKLVFTFEAKELELEVLDE